MSDIDDFRDLVKEQNRAICSMRHMMQRGYSLYLLHDRNQSNNRMNSGQWAVIKTPVPGDEKSGFILYETYDKAYQAGLKFTWQDVTFNASGKLEELGNAARRKRIKDEHDTHSTTH